MNPHSPFSELRDVDIHRRGTQRIPLKNREPSEVSEESQWGDVAYLIFREGEPSQASKGSQWGDVTHPVLGKAELG